MNAPRETHHALLVTAGPCKGAAAAIAKRHLSVGSAFGCDIRLEDVRVRPRHAELAYAADGSLWIRDLTGAGETRVQGVGVATCRLQEGALISLGGVELCLQRKRGDIAEPPAEAARTQGSPAPHPSAASAPSTPPAALAPPSAPSAALAASAALAPSAPSALSAALTVSAATAAIIAAAAPPKRTRARARASIAIAGATMLTVVGGSLVYSYSDSSTPPALASPPVVVAPIPPVAPAPVEQPLPPPPLPQPGVDLVKLTVHATPERVEIYDGDALLGTTPAVLHWEKGKRVQLRLEAQGFLPEVRLVAPLADVELEIALAPKPAPAPELPRTLKKAQPLRDPAVEHVEGLKDSPY
ncbi:MAG: FHA domain-containing protein [Myxococcaceae bacterium]